MKKTIEKILAERKKKSIYVRAKAEKYRYILVNSVKKRIMPPLGGENVTGDIFQNQLDRHFGTKSEINLRLKIEQKWVCQFSHGKCVKIAFASLFSLVCHESF